MPEIKIYVDDETYIKFLQKEDIDRIAIRKKMVEMVKEEVRGNVVNKRT